MAANQFAIYPKVPNVSTIDFGASGDGVLSAAYASTGSVLAFTAGADGAYLKSMICCALGSNAAAKVCVFYDDGTLIKLLGEVPLDTAVASTTDRNLAPVDLLELIELGGGFGMKGGHKIWIATTAAVASGYSVTSFGGDY